MKNKVGKILIFVSLCLVILSFASLFLPALQLRFEDRETRELIGNGTVISLLTIMLGMKSKIICNKIGGGTIIDEYKLSGSTSTRALVQFIVIVVLIVLAITILILFLTKKYKGILKIILSIALWALLIATVGSMFFETMIISVRSTDAFRTIQINEVAIGAAPIVFAVCGGCALVSNIIGAIFTREN